jgi:beta-lactamase regulating signal transducer with metallopeptidase domain
MLQWFGTFYSDVFLVKLFNRSVTAGMIIVVLIAVRVLLRRAPKIFSYALWGIVVQTTLPDIHFLRIFCV